LFLAGGKSRGFIVFGNRGGGGREDVDGGGDFAVYDEGITVKAGG
jgi:hypothetical protein